VESSSRQTHVMNCFILLYFSVFSGKG
jgi:hypothetical protein